MITRDLGIKFWISSEEVRLGTGWNPAKASDGIEQFCDHIIFAYHEKHDLLKATADEGAEFGVGRRVDKVVANVDVTNGLSNARLK